MYSHFIGDEAFVSPTTTIRNFISSIGGLVLTISTLVSMLCLASKSVLQRVRNIFRAIFISSTLVNGMALKDSCVQTPSRWNNLEARVSRLPEAPPLPTENIARKRIRPTQISQVPEHGVIAPVNTIGPHTGKNMETSTSAQLKAKASDQMASRFVKRYCQEPMLGPLLPTKIWNSSPTLSNTRKGMIDCEKQFQSIDHNLPKFIGYLVQQEQERVDGRKPLTRQHTDIAK